MVDIDIECVGEGVGVGVFWSSKLLIFQLSTREIRYTHNYSEI